MAAGWRGTADVDPADGGALELAALAFPPVRSIAYDALQDRVAVLSGDGLVVHAALDQSIASIYAASVT